MVVRCDSFAPRIVRQNLERLPAVGSNSDEAMLVASELVTNAIRHSHCSEEDHLTVDAQCEEDRLRISVLDPGSSGRTAQIVERPVEHGGVGLKVVEQLSQRWGSERRRDGYRVWAEIPLAA